MVHKDPGLTGTGEVSTLRPWSFASGNSSVVEHRLAKARVEGSNPFSRSSILPDRSFSPPVLILPSPRE